MKSLISLWTELAYEMGQMCTVDTTRDVLTVTSRVEHEGWSFMTIALPSYGKAFERWLDRGEVDLNVAATFSYRAGFPQLLGGFLRNVFDRNGVILPQPDVQSIIAIRQLTGLFGKMHLPCSRRKEHKALNDWVGIDGLVGQHAFSPSDLADFRRVALLTFGKVFDRVDREVEDLALVPKHGPGATADKLQGNQKFNTGWTHRLEEYFPSVDYILPSARYYNELDGVAFQTEDSEQPVRVALVPKTQKTPRIIAIEPTCMQYAQQALMAALVSAVERDDRISQITRFRDQTLNQRLAREGSIYQSLATLDLSEASDRVSNELVQELFAYWPSLRGAVNACRSRTAELPNGNVLKLSKFASMGSALTFPIEAMIFTILCLIGYERAVDRRLLASDIQSLVGMVCVYGDDIIVPTRISGSVCETLRAFGFKVNRTKSFWNGQFRESCGKDYFNGTDVSFVRCRREWPSDRQDAQNVVALVELFNQLNQRGYTRTSSWLREKLLEILDGYFPRVSATSSILGEISDVDFDVERMCPDNHVPLARGWVIQARIPRNTLDGHLALLKCLLYGGDEPLDREHLVRSGRSSAVNIKLRVAPV